MPTTVVRRRRRREELSGPQEAEQADRGGGQDGGFERVVAVETAVEVVQVGRQERRAPFGRLAALERLEDGADLARVGPPGHLCISVNFLSAESRVSDVENRLMPSSRMSQS